MRTDSTLRQTTVYSLRVANDPATHGTTADEVLDSMAEEATHHGATVTDTHAATAGGVSYVSLSYRIPSNDQDAVDMATLIRLGAFVMSREHYLHTGLGAHRRVIAG